MKTKATNKAPNKTDQQVADLSPKNEQKVRGGAIRLSDINIVHYETKSSN